MNPSVGGHEPDPTDRDEALRALAHRLGFELPAFEGPLSAFEHDQGSASGKGVYLGGDLHKVHPDAADQRPGRSHDGSLDSATIIIDDFEHEPTEAMAVGGIWCLRLERDLISSAPYLSLHDDSGTLRAWLLLPPARSMIGIAHYWLPSVAPPPSPAGPHS
jgi:hypothetical protein